ncbi:MAG TPA: NUDIX hydrolase [Gaiella sp.]|jgi:8-oxo-dGTP pyrophosphatase MutT (NUDIX family)|nr:NUDIX hydrolase [Gaiella sp.]
MEPWKTRSRRTILDLAPWLTIESHAVELPDGRVVENWPWVVSRQFSNVVAVTDEGRFVLFRQTKYGADGTTLGTAGGYLDPGEDALTAARRELLEETGYEATDWTSLGSYVVDGNRGCGLAHLFLARGARRVGDAVSDDLEEQELLTMTRAEVETALLRGEFKVMSWATAVAVALVAVKQR